MVRCALIVDDEWLVVDYARTILEELGCEVVTATCGSEALHALAADERIDLLITDVQMPDMNGLELVEQAKRQRPTLHVIVTSGNTKIPLGVAFVPKCGRTRSDDAPLFAHVAERHRRPGVTR
jgi:CheY-like chemotaxis protein